MKERLDVLLVGQGYFDSREKAKRAIMAGLVYVDGAISDKSGTKIKTDADIVVKGNKCPFVSRGGLKLAKAIDSFGFDLDGKVCMDVGASTGGFTDCMLQNGAKKVYAIDVGYGQLDYSLRNDSRVCNMEKCNFRYLEPDAIDEKPDFVSIDVSFISLKLILPVVAKLINEGGHVVCLVKPQFEAGREEVGKNGIVRDKKVHIKVIEKVLEYAENSGFTALDLTFSPVTGAKGNIEYLLFLYKTENLGYNRDKIVDRDVILATVNNSHSELK